MVVNGSCYIKTFVIDCPVEIKCEAGATLKVGELVINTTDGANGKLTYEDNTIYDEKTKTFSTKCVNHNTFLAGEKYATCTAEGYTGDETCSICGTVVKSGSKTEALGHKWDNGKVTKEPTVSEEGVPIVVTFFGTETVVRFLHPLKLSAPITVENSNR